jgi:hypothetical protein
MQAQLASVRSETALLIVHKKSSKQFPSYPLVEHKRELYALDPSLAETTARVPSEARDELGRALDEFLGIGPEISARTSEAVDRSSLRALGYIE